MADNENDDIATDATKGDMDIGDAMVEAENRALESKDERGQVNEVVDNVLARIKQMISSIKHQIARYFEKKEERNKKRNQQAEKEHNDLMMQENGGEQLTNQAAVAKPKIAGMITNSALTDEQDNFLDDNKNCCDILMHDNKEQQHNDSGLKIFVSDVASPGAHNVTDKPRPRNGND